MSIQDQDDLPRGLALTSLSEEFRNDPFSVLKHLREQAPVFLDGQLRDHVVLDVAHVQKILSDGALRVDPKHLAPTSTRMMRGEDLTAETTVLHSDGARHKRLRTLMLKALNNRSIEGFRERAREICNDLLDTIGDRREFDFVELVSRPMPTIVITEMLGIEKSLHPDFKIWSDRIIAHRLNPLADEETRALGTEASVAIDKTVSDEVYRRLDTGDRPEDLISAMIEARTSDGESFSVSEISQHAQLLLIAGNQTTTDVMGTMIKNVLENGDSYARIVADRSLVPGAVEESLRFEPPIFSTERIATEDYVIDDVTVPKGHVIAAMLTAANRDPALVQRPDEFDITRKPVSHFAFGGGAHRCIGAPLAKMECEVLFQVLIERMPGLTASDRPHVYDSNPGFRSLASYWVCAN